MSDSQDDSDGQESRRKRIRQACLNCRRKKECVYAEDRRSWKRAPVTLEVGDDDATAAAMDTINARFASLENQISTLQDTIEKLIPLVTDQTPGETGVPSKRAIRPAPVRHTPTAILQTPTPLTVQSPAPDRPQSRSLSFAADIYFRFCHSQPYALFHEPTFRQRLADDSLPSYLLWGFLSAARRYSSLPVPQPNCADDASVYAAKAWECIDLPWHASPSAENVLTVIQTIILIVSTEVPAGLCTPAHMKLGFAVRLAQNHKLNLEPDTSIPIAEQEERRRTFWSLYLQDKLISLSRGRFCAIRDEECKLSLPCSEEAFREGREEHTPLLEELIGDCVEQESVDSCCPLGLIIVMASILGRVSHYVLHDTKALQPSLPWTSTSPYATLSSALLQAEHYFAMNEDTMESLQKRCTIDGGIDQLLAGSFIFAKAMFHLSHCLLHHPFLIQQRLKSTKQKAPSIFMKTAWEKCRTHAKGITELMEMKSQNVLLLTSIYGYCIMVAALMVKRLERFHNQCESRGQELSPCTTNVERTPGDVKALWQSVDYTSLSTPTRPGSPTAAPPPTSEADWALSSDMFDFTGFGGFAEGVDVFSISFVDGDMMLDGEMPTDIGI
ncbi:putative transcriptional regulatory protein pb1a11.04c [Fusarium flagelliforme]|uniref:Putative transcriptional regulatory protein pb1a11.04c n=1 Tax=Fusarium flagelliforme TaxID=2675880 RepID=A0A395MGV8_9HYPO|nr:putative transcriptional regulatory protein pb1a11.04c [Fusarium flagelliforme]